MRHESPIEDDEHVTVERLESQRKGVPGSTGKRESGAPARPGKSPQTDLF